MKYSRIIVGFVIAVAALIVAGPTVAGMMRRLHG